MAVEAYSTVEMQRIGDRLRGIGDQFGGLLDIISTLRGIDIKIVIQLMTEAKKISESETTEEKVDAVLRFLQVAVQLTATQADDKLLTFIEMVLTDSVKKTIVTLIDSWQQPGIRSQEMSDKIHQDREAVEALGIDWAFVMSIASLIMEFIERFLSSQEED